MSKHTFEPIGTVHSNEMMARTMLKRVMQRGPIIVIHAHGAFAGSNGAKFTQALIALPGESTDDCLVRHEVVPHEHDCIFNFNFEPVLDDKE